jgi:hypothetical protein
MIMTQKEKKNNRQSSAVVTQARGNQLKNRPDDHLGSDDLRDSPMMARLLGALEAGEDIGQYGRLTFTMVARHFIDEDQIVKLLAGQPGMDDERALALVAQVKERDYNPPKRERILEWQSKQEFQICPDADDSTGCNVYRELRFPQEIYDRIDQFWEEKAEE